MAKVAGNTYHAKIDLLLLAKEFYRFIIFRTHENLRQIFILLYANMILIALMNLLKELDVDIMRLFANWTINVYKLFVFLLIF